MADLRSVLAARVDDGSLPGAVALVAHGERVEVAAAGSLDLEGTAPMTRDSVFRLASITKPVTAAATMTLVDDGTLGLDDPIDRWLPELAHPVVMRRPDGPLDDVVPVARPITVADLLTFRAGWGLPADFSRPVMGVVFSRLMQDPLQPQVLPPPEEWTARLAGIPLQHQPGEGWLYNTGSDVLGVLLARASGRPLPELLAERLFGPLGMRETGFHVPAGSLPRFTGQYLRSPSGGLELHDAADGPWTAPPAFPSGAGGLVSTADDWFAFGRMLLRGGLGADGTRVLSAGSVRLMLTNHLTPAQSAAAGIFLRGQGWGFGGSVDVAGDDPWNVPGRYGWVGGSGTAAYVVPARDEVTVVLTQVALTGPTSVAVMEDVWRYAAGLLAGR